MQIKLKKMLFLYFTITQIDEKICTKRQTIKRLLSQKKDTFIVTIKSIFSFATFAPLTRSIFISSRIYKANKVKGFRVSIWNDV